MGKTTITYPIGAYITVFFIDQLLTEMKLQIQHIINRLQKITLIKHMQIHQKTLKIVTLNLAYPGLTHIEFSRIPDKGIGPKPFLSTQMLIT